MAGIVAFRIITERRVSLPPVNRIAERGYPRPQQPRARNFEPESKAYRHTDMAAREIRAVHRSAAHRRGCDASAVRPGRSRLRALARPPIAPSVRRCRGCGNVSRRGRPRSGRARRPASLGPAERRAAGSRPPPPSPSSATTSWMFGSRSTVSNALKYDAGIGSSIRSRALPSGSSASIWTMMPTSSRRARRMVTDEAAAMDIS